MTHSGDGGNTAARTFGPLRRAASRGKSAPDRRTGREVRRSAYDVDVSIRSWWQEFRNGLRAVGLDGRAFALRDRGELEEALACCRQAIEVAGPVAGEADASSSARSSSARSQSTKSRSKLGQPHLAREPLANALLVLQSANRASTPANGCTTIRDRLDDRRRPTRRRRQLRHLAPASTIIAQSSSFERRRKGSESSTTASVDRRRRPLTPALSPLRGERERRAALSPLRAARERAPDSCPRAAGHPVSVCRCPTDRPRNHGGFRWHGPC